MKNTAKSNKQNPFLSSSVLTEITTHPHESNHIDSCHFAAVVCYSTTNSQDDYGMASIINGQFTYTLLAYKSVSNSLLVNSFVQYYVPLTSSFYFTLQGQLNFARTANDQTSPQYNGAGYDEVTKRSPSYGVGMTIRPSFIFFPAPQWGIEAGIGYLSFTRTRYLPDAYSSNNLSFNAGSFSLGLAYYFGKKTN